MRRAFVLIITVAFAVNLFPQQQKLSFIEEYIDFKLDKDSFDINGVYLLYNTSDKPVVLGIEFPFATSADSVNVQRVYNLNTNKSVEYLKRGNSIFFTVRIAPLDTVSYNIAYKQPAAKENVYVLLSTHAWGKPLQKVRYSLKVDKDIEVGYISYPFDSLSADGIYKWEKYDFMPDKNFIVTVK